MGKMESVGKRIERSAVVCVAGMLVIFVISGIVTGTPSVFGYRVFFILSESMEPTIHVHQFVLGKVMGEDELEIGEIAAYEKDVGLLKKMVIHRVVRIDDDGMYILQGDNNDRADEPVGRGQIKYRIIAGYKDP